MTDSVFRSKLKPTIAKKIYAKEIKAQTLATPNLFSFPRKENMIGKEVNSINLHPIYKGTIKKNSTIISSFRIPRNVEFFFLSLFMQSVLAQSTPESSADTPKTMSPLIDSTVACIIARELAEGTMFVASHFGAVVKNSYLSKEEKQHYLNALVPGLICGVFTGGAISIGVGFILSKAIGSLDSAENGLELGEAISKTIGAWFVTKMTLKIPQWFGISNYHAPTKPTNSQNQTDLDLENENKIEINQNTTLESRLTMAFSLFWNSLRETTEGGVLTAMTALLSKNSMDSLGPSVAVGAGSALILGGGMALGAKYISPRGFGIAAATLAELLAIGLITGAVRSFEEVYASGHEDKTSPVIYDLEGTQIGDALTAFEFMGISDHLTALQLTTWIVSAASITGLHIWQNYFGKSLVPEKLKNGIKCK